MNRDLSGMRENYKRDNLSVEKAIADPYVQFKKWLQAAIDADVIEANAMNLATVNSAGRPSSRIVLLKEIDDDAFIFYTNYGSRKSSDLAQNPLAALNFLWKEIERQVRIEGVISKISRQRSEEYFHMRPFESQIGALSSFQSSKIQDREILEQRFQENYDKYKSEGKAPMPSNWGGYKLEADYFEFWQGRESRLHDRLAYKLVGKKWLINRLEP